MSDEYISLQEQIAAIREDTGYIRSKLEVVDDHEDRLQKVEHRVWSVPGSLIAALVAALVSTHK